MSNVKTSALRTRVRSGNSIDLEVREKGLKYGLAVFGSKPFTIVFDRLWRIDKREVQRIHNAKCGMGHRRIVRPKGGSQVRGNMSQTTYASLA